MCLNSDGNIAIADLVNDTPQPPISDQTRPGENTITKELQEHRLFTQTTEADPATSQPDSLLLSHCTNHSKQGKNFTLSLSSGNWLLDVSTVYSMSCSSLRFITHALYTTCSP